MSEFGRMLDSIPGWVGPLAGGVVLGIILCFAVLGYRTFMGTTVEFQTVAVEVPVRDPEPASAAASSWQAPLPPWYDCGLPEPEAPLVDTRWRGFGIRPDGSEFTGEDTCSFEAIGFVMPKPAPKAEIVDEPRPAPRARFATDPKLPEPVALQVLTVTLPDEVITSQIEVPS